MNSWLFHVIPCYSMVIPLFFLVKSTVFISQLARHGPRFVTF